MNKILLIDKPVGFSTFDLIRIYKRSDEYKKQLQEDLPAGRRVGHAGTLDVFAEGLCILLLGEATKQFADFLTVKKTYIAGIRLGASTTTLDVEGDVVTQNNPIIPKKEDIEAAIFDFPKVYEQSVPSYSAAKQNGKPLYKLARVGADITPKSKQITIHELRLIAYKWPLATVEATCSSGTYIRQLTYDLFKNLDLDSFLFSLKRTAVGDFRLKDAQSLV